ncbi:MAG: hypothetical protein Q4C41_06750 [Eggerthellaceae bacterium]|nr:hypothetical protein [Eggerthellaceae bacterium]
MKTCPVCRTTLFDDMDTCYGCMYRFGSNAALEEKVRRETDAAVRSVVDEKGESSTSGEAVEVDKAAAAKVEVGAGASAGEGDMAPVEAVDLAEGARDMRTWIVRLEVRNGNDPDQTWSVELVPPYDPAPNKGGLGAQASVPLPREPLALSVN